MGGLRARLVLELIPILLTVVQPEGEKESTKTNTFAEHLPSFTPVDLQGRHSQVDAVR